MCTREPCTPNTVRPCGNHHRFHPSHQYCLLACGVLAGRRQHVSTQEHSRTWPCPCASGGCSVLSRKAVENGINVKLSHTMYKFYLGFLWRLFQTCHERCILSAINSPLLSGYQCGIEPNLNISQKRIIFFKYGDSVWYHLILVIERTFNRCPLKSLGSSPQAHLNISFSV